MIRYTLSRQGTGQGVGWFSCIPEGNLSFTDLAVALREHPNDQFLRRYALERMGDLAPDELIALVETGGEHRPMFRSLAAEATVVFTKFEPLRERLPGNRLETLVRTSPLIYLRWLQAVRPESHETWLRLFSENMTWHRPLPPPDASDLFIPYEPETLAGWLSRRVRVKGAFGVEAASRDVSPDRREVRERVKALNRKLELLGILRGWESRTEATISPYAVERPWHLDVSLKQGRNHWNLQGELVSYGRGLNIHQARISCLMEIVERYSAFCRADELALPGYRAGSKLVKGSCSELKKTHEVVAPDEFLLEVPYEDQVIHWVAGERRGPRGFSSVLVPAQMVFLFANMDEPGLTAGLSSTGLGAGRTMEEARLSGLLEVLERDAEKVVPYCENRRFLLTAEHPGIRDILEGLSRKGIQIQFLDLTHEFGIPCFKAFIQGPGGMILKGTAANLDGKRAAVSAMTEIPYPYPYWFGSAMPPEGLRTIRYEDLPCFSSGDASTDLGVVEEVLLRNGYQPIYVDLTGEDLEIPVVRVLVPGLELTSVLDRFSSLSFRKFAFYLASLRE